MVFSIAETGHHCPFLAQCKGILVQSTVLIIISIVAAEWSPLQGLHSSERTNLEERGIKMNVGSELARETELLHISERGMEQDGQEGQAEVDQSKADRTGL
jgi:hypothetical protein